MGLYQLWLRLRRGLWPRLRPGSPEFSAVVARGGRGAAAAPCSTAPPLPARCRSLRGAEGDAAVDCDAMVEGDGAHLLKGFTTAARRTSSCATTSTSTSTSTFMKATRWTKAWAAWLIDQVVDRPVAFAAVQPPFSTIDQPRPSPDGAALSLSLSLSRCVSLSLVQLLDIFHLPVVQATRRPFAPHAAESCQSR